MIIQCRNIHLEHDELLDCGDSEHCTNHPISTQCRSSLNSQDIDDLYTDDDAESYDTMDTDMTQPDDFFTADILRILMAPIQAE